MFSVTNIVNKKKIVLSCIFPRGPRVFDFWPLVTTPLFADTANPVSVSNKTTAQIKPNHS